MELKNKLVGIVGAAAMVVGLTAGIATAQVTDTASMPTSVQITCPTPAQVYLSGDATFAPIANILTQDDTSTAPNSIDLLVDMGCYWGPWQVNAQVSNFIAGPGLWFSSSHLSLEDATVESYFLDPIDGPFDLLEPTANDADFFGPADQDVILETTEVFVFWPFPAIVDLPAPFVTTASYTGVLTDLPIVLSGNYVATLTVELATD